MRPLRTPATHLLLCVVGSVALGPDSAAQCPGTWSPSGSLDYLCANGPFLQFELGADSCATAAQLLFTPSDPVPTIEFTFSAFGTASDVGSSRMSVFLNEQRIDLALACSIQLDCQENTGGYAIDGGCLVDEVAGTDGGISGHIRLNAADHGVGIITSLGVAVTEPDASGTIFQVGACGALCAAGLGADHSRVHARLAPQPFTHETMLRWDRPLSAATITLVDAQGKRLRELRNIHGESMVLHRGDLPSGLYQLLLSEGGRQVAALPVMVADN